MTIRDMENDRSRLEQREIAFFIGWDLPERMKRKMCSRFHRTEGKQPNVVGLVCLFECPANTHVTRQSPAEIGGPFKVIVMVIMGDPAGLVHRETSPDNKRREAARHRRRLLFLAEHPRPLPARS